MCKTLDSKLFGKVLNQVYYIVGQVLSNKFNVFCVDIIWFHWLPA